MDTKLIRVQLSKTIQSGGFLGDLFGKFVGPLMKFAASLAKIILAPLATMTSATATDSAIQRNVWARSCKSGKINHFRHFKGKDE